MAGREKWILRVLRRCGGNRSDEPNAAYYYTLEVWALNGSVRAVMTVIRVSNPELYLTVRYYIFGSSGKFVGNSS